MPASNPLIRDRDVDFLLYDVLDVESLRGHAYFADHGRDTFAPFLQSVRRFARELVFPTYRTIDEAPPTLRDGRVRVHPLLHELYPRLVALGMASAGRSLERGGQQMPLVVTTLASAYLMAANLSVYGYVGLTAGAAHLIDAFGSDDQRARFADPLYAGELTGTMALTEPSAGSSLADVRTRATPMGDGRHRISGSKIFISGGDHDLTDNIVHMTLARIDGAPAGIKGVSLFAVPKLRDDGGRLVDNDVSVAGVIHKIGWRGLPSLALNFGERGDCIGELVGAPNRGIHFMFQMMNEARIMVGVNGVATASVAYLAALAYAEERPQGRAMTSRDPASPQDSILVHADVRRMLLRQKAIVEGGLALVAQTALLSDLANHADDSATRARSALLLDLLTPVAKSFPAERGFESNALALQVHGGYGYSSEYPLEAWLRDQKLNSIHEGTTGIQGLDLLGRRVMAEGGAALVALGEEIARACDEARSAGVDARLATEVGHAFDTLASLTRELAGLGLRGDVEAMLAHSADYLELFSIVVVAWQWLRMASVATVRAAETPDPFFAGKISAATYWLRTEVPRVEQLAALCRSGEDSYLRVDPRSF